MLEFFRKIIAKFTGKTPDINDIYEYLAYYKCEANETTHRNQVSSMVANQFIISFFKQRGKKVEFHQLTSILGNYYMFFGTKPANTKGMYILMLMIVTKIKYANYSRPDEYIASKQIIDGHEVKIYKI